MNFTLKVLTSLSLVATMAHAGIIATVNGKQITDEEVNQVLMEGTQGRFNTLPAEKQNELRTRIIEGMITQELVYNDAKKTGVLKTPEYKQELDKVMVRVEQQLAAKVWQDLELAKVKVSDADAKAYFDSHKEEFVEKEKVHARHILVKDEADAKAITAELAPLKGVALKEKFITLAKEKSVGPSGPKGGDLGFFPQGQMVPEFNEVVFKMAVESVTVTPVKTQFGYHVIYLEEKKVGKTLGFDEVKTFIDQRLKMEKFKTVMEARMLKLKNSATITYGK